MHQVCEVVAGRIESGHYNMLVQEITKPWKGLEKWLVRRNSARFDVCHIATGEEDAQSIRLDFKAIMDYFHEHQAHRTYLMQPCAMNIATGEQAILAYVMRKYNLWKAADKKIDMEAMMKLALAKPQAEVEIAMASPDICAYDLIRHIELRQQYTIVF